MDMILLENFMNKALEKIDGCEEQNRLDVVVSLLENKNIDSDHVLFELVETEKNMTEKQIEILEYVRKQLTKFKNKNKHEILNIMKIMNLLSANTDNEGFYIVTTELISKLSSIEDRDYFLIKGQIDYILGNMSDIDTSSKYSVIESLLDEGKRCKTAFDDNYQKIKRRKEINNE